MAKEKEQSTVPKMLPCGFCLHQGVCLLWKDGRKSCLSFIL